VSARQIASDGRVDLSDGTVLEPAVIVGGDGPRSLAGRAIGQSNTALVETRQINVPLLVPHLATDIFLSAELPGGYAWLFPKGRIANLGAGVDTAHKAALKDIVARLHAELAASGRVGAEVLGMTGGLIPVGGMLTPWGTLPSATGSAEGKGTLVLLAGDAAGLTNPVTGAGIASAVHSGRLAGRAAGEWLAGNRSAGAEYQEELESVFMAALDRAVRRRRELSEIFAAGIGPGKAALRRGWIAYPEYWAA
jgi:flavin-dependent dehydrogenase